MLDPSHGKNLEDTMSVSDQEDDDLKAAIAMSLAESNASLPTGVSPTAPSNDNERSSTVQPSTKAGMAHIGLDRKVMEEQRLARLKRKLERPISPPEGRRKAPKLTEDTIVEKTITFPSGARLNMISSLVQQDQQKRKPVVANSANERLTRKPLPSDARIKIEEDDDGEKKDRSEMPSPLLQYPKGVVKKTWAFGHPRAGDDVKLEEVLEPLTLKTAVLSAFQWDTNWLLSKLKIPPNGGSTKCIFVMQGKEAAQREEMFETAREMRSFLRLCFPPMEGQVHCMHSKLMLLFHPQKLRIAIPTANLLNFDWGETGFMENSVFMIDLPRLPKNATSTPGDLTYFGRELLFFLEKQGLDADVRAGVLNFDFRGTKQMAFVHTVGGTSFDQDAHRTGLAGLSGAVRSLNLHTDSLDIDFAASSIGSLNDAFLTNVHSAARGEDLIAQASASASATKSDFFAPASSRQGSASKPVSIREHIRIYFPTRETVLSSTAGTAGTICLSRNWFEAGTFPRTCFRDYKSTRAGLLSHNKILCARGKREDASTGKVENVAWLYVGSSNMSESAWGKVSLNKKRGDVRINCRNWECGVLLPVTEIESQPDMDIKKERTEGGDSETESEHDASESTESSGSSGKLVDMSVFKDVMDLPFQVPGERYGGKQPWYFKERA